MALQVSRQKGDTDLIFLHSRFIAGARITELHFYVLPPAGFDTLLSVMRIAMKARNRPLLSVASRCINDRYEIITDHRRGTHPE